MVRRFLSFFSVSLYRSLVALFVGIFAVAFAVPWFGKTNANPGTPKLANYYLHWELNDATVRELARWDVVVLDMEVQARSKFYLQKLRELNPKIIILAYVTSQEIHTNPASSPGAMRRTLGAGIQDSWYLRDVNGKQMSFWSGTVMLNVADNSPSVNGQRWTNHLARFVAQELLSTDLWDGVFYDNSWDGITWFAGNNADLDRDGATDSSPNDHWQAGMRNLFNETRRLVNKDFIIVGNGGTKAYRNELNGVMLENFPNTGGWPGTMDIYDFYQNGERTPRVIILNRTTLNSGKRNNYRSMRFGLGSSLLGDDGYYAFDYGDKDHGQLWWYDEYDVSLGEPVGAATSLNGERPFAEGVWQREYEHGVTVVNASSQAQEVDLGGEYEKIIGKQDPGVNDGSIVDKVKLSAYDGLLMYKTFRTIQNAVFSNGAFIRFFKRDGTRARNGFFAFEEGYPGGTQIYNGDLDGDGKMEKIVGAGSELTIYNSRGEKWFSGFPFGGNFTGQMHIAVGRLNAGPEVSIVVAPSVGGKIQLYNYHGALEKDELYPLGKKYRGGFSVGIGNLDGAAGAEIVVGVGKGRTGEILVYDSGFSKIKKRFVPFARNLGGVNLAVGDFNADGRDEIAVVQAASRTPLVRQFDISGKKLIEFPLRGFFGVDSFTLGVADVNFEGKDEIVVMSAN